jgi:hypothetical protein
LRNSDWLTKHCERLELGGSYYDFITSGKLTDWVIIDYTYLNPRNFISIPGAKLIRVIFDEDYASAEILDANNVVVAPKFPLLS